MYFIRNVYYWASQGYPDAVPAGVIAVNLESTEDLTSNVREVALALTSQGFMDDTGYQCGVSSEDQDLILKLVPHERHGEIGQYLTSDQLLSDWQFELLKQQPGLTISEHTLSEMEGCECCECD